MLIRLLGATAALALTLGAVDVTGTWKLNAAKSKYEGMPQPKDMTVVYTSEGSGFRYDAKGTTGEGTPVSSSWVYVKDGADIAMTGSPFGDTLVLSGADKAVTTGVFKRNGKAVGKVKRTLSADGKVMTIAGHSLTADGKKVTYTAVYEKQ
jgi:hypothetical protein